MATRGDAFPAQENLRRLFDLSLDLLCVAGLDGYFKHVNPAFTRVLGYRAEELLSQAFIELIHPDDRASTLAAVERLAQGLDIVDFENRYRAADGSYRWLAWRSTSVPEDGLVFATARDVTEHKRLQELARRQAEDLVRSNADLEQFAAIASHDLQAPLRGVHTLADWIEEELPEDAPGSAHEHLETLRRRVDLMARLVTDLLAYARAGREEEVMGLTDTGALVANIVEMVAPPAGFEVVVDDDLPELETISSALEQVLRNLIANAIQHHDRESGTIRVGARRRGAHWEFSVADDGPGIPPEARDKVFEMLWSSASGERRGTGMGLALVRRLVERVGGRAWIDPDNGRGTTVRFTWPNKLVG